MDILDDPRVEWELVELAHGWDRFRWTASVDGKIQTGLRMHEDSAIEDMRRFVRVNLNGGRIGGRTTPCVICDNPSRVGMATDTDECQRLLDKARAELP